MRFLLNVIWLLLSGFWLAVSYAFFAALLCLTLVFLPFGLQLFKLAAYALWPFGRTAVHTSGLRGASTLGNLLWLPLGIILACIHLVSAVACALTIIGIPFAVANVKLVGLALAPFGRSIVASREVSGALAARGGTTAV